MTQKQQSETVHTEPFGVEIFSQLNQDVLSSSLSGPQKVAELASESLAEWLAFVSRRAKAQAELYGGLCHCHQADEAAEMQQRFATKCAKDYSDEFSQMMELGLRNMQLIASLALLNNKHPDKAGGTA